MTPVRRPEPFLRRSDGDDWVVNGQKVWTTGAHFSDFGILLARTNPVQAKGYLGIALIAGFAPYAIYPVADSLLTPTAIGTAIAATFLSLSPAFTR